jgi:chemotaxis protein MotB
MTRYTRFGTLLAAALCAAPMFASCASQQYQTALDERDAENRALREDNAQLKGQLRDARYQNESLEAALAEANARLLAEPETESRPRDAELEGLGVGVGTRDGNVVYTLPQEITFASGKADLTSGGKRALDAVAQRLRAEFTDAEYYIEGHTDTDPIRKSSFDSNRDLSVARAMAVLRYLVDSAGIKDGQCALVAWGEYRPLTGNDSAANKARNRRVEITVKR